MTATMRHGPATFSRRRLLLLQRQIEAMLDRWPDPDRQIANIWARRLARFW